MIDTHVNYFRVSFGSNELVTIMHWPYMQVAILDGITMGCGGGISLPGMFRLVTDKTVCGAIPSQIFLVLGFV